MMHDLSHQIASKLKEKNLSIGRAEKRAKIAVGTIDKIVSNISTNPRLDTLVALKTLFGCSIDELTFDALFMMKVKITPFMDKKAFEDSFDMLFFIDVLLSLQAAQKKFKKKLPPKEFLETAFEAYGWLWNKDLPLDEFISILLEKNLSF
jgi:transcriptional regulator with XRE-family HTH domain